MNNVPLQELSIKISSGLTPLRSNPEFWDSQDIPWVKTEQLGVKHIYDSNEKISNAALEKTSLKLNPVNSISVAMYGEGRTRGSVSIFKSEMTTNQACCNIVIDEEKAHYEYIYYFLKTQYQELRNLSSGVRKNLNSNDIKSFEVRLPQNKKDQIKIASVLSALDEKIELNNKINTELESMAKLIYDYWFIQFDFPDANGKPYKSSGGKMVYNEELKREIPDGWTSGNIMHLANLLGGGTPKTTIDKYWGGSIPFFTPADAEDNIYSLSTKENITIDGLESCSSKLYGKGTVFITARGTVGKINIASCDMAMNQSCYALQGKKGISSVFVYFYAKELIQYVKSKASGSIFKALVTNDFKFTELIIPQTALITKFTETVEINFDKILLNKKENKKLIELRDWLLPMLMNGQVTIKG